MTKEVLLENLKQYPTILQQLIYLTAIVGDLSNLADYQIMTASEGKELAEAILNR